MRLLRFSGLVLTWLVILTSLAAVAVLVPRLAGATPYTVLTGSMRPQLPPGTLVVVEPVDPDELRVGDVITYQLESGKRTVVTHRIVSVDIRLDGETVFTTQGDANDTPDAASVRPVQVRGRLWYAVPYLGYLNNALDGRQRQSAVVVVATALAGYAAFMFVGAVRDRRRGRRGRRSRPDPAPPDPTASPEVDEPDRDRAAGHHLATATITATILALLLTLLLLTRRRLRR